MGQKEPKFGQFYTYDHSDYTNTGLFFKKSGGFYYFIEIDDGGAYDTLWVEKITLDRFNSRYEEADIHADYYKMELELFFNAIKNLFENYKYDSWDIELTEYDLERIKSTILVFKTKNHYGDSKDNYKEYLQSKHWKQIRVIMLNKFGKCQVCGSIDNLEVHHNSYDHIGEEKEHLEDLVVLCHDCHAKFHNKH